MSVAEKSRKGADVSFAKDGCSKARTQAAVLLPMRPTVRSLRHCRPRPFGEPGKLWTLGRVSQQRGVHSSRRLARAQHSVARSPAIHRSDHRTILRQPADTPRSRLAISARLDRGVDPAHVVNHGRESAWTSVAKDAMIL